MLLLRRFIPAFAALLAVLVAVQATDLVACADEAAAVTHGEATHTDAPDRAGHPVPATGDTHGGDHEVPVDCLCHVVFTPMAVAPVVGAPAPEAAAFALFVAARPDAELQGTDPVPLA